MNHQSIADHLDRATQLNDEIRQLEQVLDQLIFSRATNSVAPPPENFFRSYLDQSKELIASAKNEYKRNKEIDPQDVAPVPEETFQFPPNFGKIIGTRIRKRREELGLTQKDLTDRTGIRRPNIARLEKGDGLPNLSTLMKVSTGLRISLAGILTTNPK